MVITMRKFIVPLICYGLIIIVLFNVDKISSYLAKVIQSNQVLTIPKKSEYAKNDEFLYIKNSKDYIPYSYNDLLSIIYTSINNGWTEFTFYCPSEYENCVEDATRLTKDEVNLTHINNFVHPYNSFNTLKTSITESGQITLNIDYLYQEDEKQAINEYVNKLINELVDSSKDDNENLKKIHDYIINHTKYDVERNNTGNSQYKSYSAYGAIKDGYATCNGYADLMAIILSKLNYKNYKIATTKGEVNSDSNGHVWNGVYVNDKWLHLDLTWDDPVSSDGKDYLYHKYYLVNNEELKKADSGSISVEEHNFDKSIYQEFNY